MPQPGDVCIEIGCTNPGVYQRLEAMTADGIPILSVVCYDHYTQA